MKPRLIICEGPDNCGKSTLAKRIAEHFHGVYWRLTSGKGLSEHDAMRLYQQNALDNAEINIREMRRVVVLDRHWPSDQVYGPVLRGRPSCSGIEMEARCATLDAVYIYCHRKNMVEEHAKSKDPDHPYEDSVYEQVVLGYDNFFHGLQQRRDVIGYYLNNFINREEQLKMFFEGLTKV